MLKRESYRSAHSPFTSVTPLLDSEFDDFMSESWSQDIHQPKFRNGLPVSSMAELSA